MMKCLNVKEESLALLFWFFYIHECQGSQNLQHFLCDQRRYLDPSTFLGSGHGQEYEIIFGWIVDIGIGC